VEPRENPCALNVMKTNETQEFYTLSFSGFEKDRVYKSTTIIFFVY